MGLALTTCFPGRDGEVCRMKGDNDPVAWRDNRMAKPLEARFERTSPRPRALLCSLGAVPLAISVIGLSAALGLSCGGDAVKETRYCQTTREYFIESVWEPIVSKKCIECHTPYG